MEAKFRLINKALLKVDRSYQRPELHSERQTRMRQHWSWEMCGTLLVGERSDGSLWIVDGQQRWAVARDIESITALPCMVFKSDGPKHEAEVYYNCGCIRTALTPHNKYQARLMAGDPQALEIEKRTRQKGYHIAPSDAIDAIDCIGSIIYAYNGCAFSEKEPALVALDWAMTAANHRFKIKRDLYSGFNYLARRDINYLTDDHIAKLAKYSGQEIYQRIAACGVSEGRERAGAVAIIQLINHNRPVKNRLPYPDVLQNGRKKDDQ